jgi:hypothetical protein
MHNDKSTFCRVCGLRQADPPWGEDGRTPTYEICSCCGVEFGYEDSRPESVRRYRTEWIRKGAEWFTPQDRPAVWDMEQQFNNIPPEFR